MTDKALIRIAADRVALGRFQQHIARELYDAEERGRVQTRIEWRGYLRKAIMRERGMRAELIAARELIAQLRTEYDPECACDVCRAIAAYDRKAGRL